MARIIERTNETEDLDGTRTRSTKVVEDDDTTNAASNTQNMATRLVWLIASIIIGLLAIRFVLVLLGANPANAFADFIYSTSRPLVSPFFSLFNYDFSNGTARFEAFTLVAMAVYAILAGIISRLININRPVERV